MTLIRQSRNSLDRISNSMGVSYSAKKFSEDNGHSSVLEMKTNGMEDRVVSNRLSKHRVSSIEES